MTWDSLSRDVVARYPHAIAGDGTLRLVLVRGDARIGIWLRAVTAYDETAIVISADLGPSNGIEPWLGLGLNSQLAHGALAIEGSVLVLRCCVPLAGMTSADFDRRLRRVAAEAANLKTHLVIQPPRTNSFAHYAD